MRVRLPIAAVMCIAFISAMAWARPEMADDASQSGAVRVKFAGGATELATLQEGVRYFSNRRWTLQNLPPEILGLTFTRRVGGNPANAEIAVSGAATVYLLVDSADGPNHGEDVNQRLAGSGWVKLPDDASYTARGTKVCPISIYKMEATSAERIKVEGASWAGFVVAASNLALGSEQAGAAPDRGSADSTPVPEAAPVDLTAAGPTTQISKLQTSIETLYVVEQPSGGMLGSASRLILTASPGVAKKGDVVPLSFATRVGPEMKLVLDEVARAINVHYRLAGVEKIELSFEDKYSAKDGGSIGAAIGTLMLSMIEGYDIDPNLAITGDVSADSKVLRIGGVAAKLRGAADSGCTIAAVPQDNAEQVRDALVYEGPSLLTNVQVIGMSDLDDAAAICRVDREAKLAGAIRLFGEIQKSMLDSSDYLYTPEALAKLHEVLSLAPNHLSARFLILASQHKLPRLTAAASEYYTFVAVREYLSTPATGKTSAQATDYSSEIAREKLKKLRPMADLAVVPFIDAWSDYIQAFEEWRHGVVTATYVNDKNQEVLNEETKLNTNRDLAEKMLREGI